MAIQQLPPSVVNKIAAGEVIERPASVVKELLENSVDAAATRIDVTLGEGGADFIRVTDDGIGIAAQQLPLAVSSHATSKIRNAEDLFNVGTLGFRGEALASIAEVSRFTLRSRTAESDSGYEMTVVGGKTQESVPCGCAIGTSVEVRQLFYNTPVRRKFLRTKQTEMGHCNEALTRIALANPEVHFTLTQNSQLITDLPRVDDWRQRIVALFGDQIGHSLIAITGEDDGGIQLRGFVADPSQSRSNNRMQYLLLNGRYIRDRSLQHALVEAYRGLLMTGRFPVTFLRITLPPEMVDVNVHPTKLEVRFQDSGRLYSKLLGTLRTKFLSSDLVHPLQVTSPPSGIPVADHQSPTISPPRNQLHLEVPTVYPDGATNRPQVSPPGSATIRQASWNHSRSHDPRNDTTGLDEDPSNEISTGDTTVSTRTSQETHAVTLPESHPATTSLHSNATCHTAMQVHDSYIVTETEEGVAVLDQHALHERVLYEQLRKRVLAGQVETQRLLVPEPVDLTPAESATVLENRASLAELGIEVEPFGGDTVIVAGYPAMLAKLNPGEILRQVIELLLTDGKKLERRDLLDDLMHMISCKAAVKAGDHLTPEEVSSLVEQRELAQDSHHCPHGRPTVLVLTKQELDRKFGRT
ncbi:MAG: DNA mismatch repair protein MutL [Planctomycetaceae bacterium]|nr:DNA mismatch repair protein MutL [Planctomycetaceae bacterium]MBP62468.1 DNA mismatch repair protein MutL [Planctomycetaceae bacterium]